MLIHRPLSHCCRIPLILWVLCLGGAEWARRPLQAEEYLPLHDHIAGSVLETAADLLHEGRVDETLRIAYLVQKTAGISAETRRRCDSLLQECQKAAVREYLQETESAVVPITAQQPATSGEGRSGMGEAPRPVVAPPPQTVADTPPRDSIGDALIAHAPFPLADSAQAAEPAGAGPLGAGADQQLLSPDRREVAPSPGLTQLSSREPAAGRACVTEMCQVLPATIPDGSATTGRYHWVVVAFALIGGATVLLVIGRQFWRVAVSVARRRRRPALAVESGPRVRDADLFTQIAEHNQRLRVL